MRKVAMMFAVASLCMAVPAAAEDADLLARVEALEERVASLEAQLSSTPSGVSAAPEQEVVPPGDVETGIVTEGGCSLEYRDFAVTQSYDGKDCVALYFDFFNGSGETTSALYEFHMTVYQNGREQPFAVLSGDQAYDDRDTTLRSGADAIRVCFASMLEDDSDIIVNLKASDRSVDEVEFSLSLK